MVGVALCLYIFTILLNGSQVFSEDTTPSIATSTCVNCSDSKSTTVESKDVYTSSIPTRKADVTPLLTKSEEQTTITEAEKHGKRTTKSINDYVTERSTNDPLNTVPVARYVQEPVQDVDEIIESLINKPKWNFRDELEHERNATYRRINQESEPEDKRVQRPAPSYLGKLTGNLVIPALKARQAFGDAWTKTSDGFKNIGSGTYDAAAGAYNFVKDTATAVVKG